MLKSIKIYVKLVYKEKDFLKDPGKNNWVGAPNVEGIAERMWLC